MKQEAKDTGTKDELFTGGEWETEYCLDGAIFVNSGEEIICHIQGEDGNITPKMEANAALIASARAMYRALNKFMDVIKGVSSVPYGSTFTVSIPAEVFEEASIALQKATPNK